MPVTAHTLRHTHAFYVPLSTIFRRLCFQQQHLFAARIAVLLRTSLEPIVLHWCVAMIRAAPSAVSDLDLFSQLREKLSLAPTCPLSSLVSQSVKLGRRTLALSLLQLEPKPSTEISKLLALGEYQIALSRALASQEVDLVHAVLSHCSSSMNFNALVQLITDNRPAIPIYAGQLRENRDLATLKDFYFHANMMVDAAKIIIEQAYQEPNLRDRLTKLAAAKELLLREGKVRSDQDNWLLPALEMQINVLTTQRQWASEQSDSSIIDAPVSEMVEKFVTRAQSAKATKVKQSFGVSDNHFWHIEVRSLAESGAWAELAQRMGLSSSRKSVPPIGYEPVIEACIANAAPKEAAKYIALLADPAEQMTWYCNINCFQEAAEVAFKEKDPDALTTIRLRSGKANLAIHATIDKYLQQLGH